MEQATETGGNGVHRDVEPEEAGMQWPAGLKAPKGARFAYVPISPEVHGNPERGDIVVIMWELSYREEKIAAKRAKGEMEAIADHRIRSSIRAVDGVVVELATGAGDTLLDHLLEDIGSSGRAFLISTYADTFMPTEEQLGKFKARVRTGTIA
jgi:hypothetical protein